MNYGKDVEREISIKNKIFHAIKVLATKKHTKRLVQGFVRLQKRHHKKINVRDNKK